MFRTFHHAGSCFSAYLMSSSDTSRTNVSSEKSFILSARMLMATFTPTFFLLSFCPTFHGPDQTRRIELLLFLISGNRASFQTPRLILCVTDQHSSDCFFANDRKFILSPAGFIGST